MGSVASQLPSCPLLFRSPVVKHYKVKREGPKYVIDVEDPVSFGVSLVLSSFRPSLTDHLLSPSFPAPR